MSKLKRDIDSWSMRVMMSKTRVWAVVEGKSIDTPFYEGVLDEVFSGEDVEVIKAEDIEIGGVSAGGKESSLKAFRHFQTNGKLNQKNLSTAVSWLFFVDRDDDDFTGALVDSPHVIYTRHADVEAEVFANAPIVPVISVAYSLASSTVRSVELGNPLQDLAELWSEWIALRLATAMCGAGGARFRQTSQVNTPVYGPHDPILSDAISERAAAEVGADNWQTSKRAADEFLENRRREMQITRSVKGKWIPSYLAHLLHRYLSDDHELPKVSSSHILSVGVARLDFSHPWMDYYKNELAAITRPA